MRQDPLNWILLQRKMQEMQQTQIQSNTQWANRHHHLTEEDSSLFKLACGLKDAATKMTEEEEERPLNTTQNFQNIDYSRVRELISICK